MAEKKEQAITITRATVAGGADVSRGDVLVVGADITQAEARLLVNIGKAKHGEHDLKAKPSGKPKARD